jgi:hypothetical protein
VNKELIAKPKRKYVKKPLPKTRDEQFKTRNRSKKPNGNLNKVRDNNIVIVLSSLLKTISGLGNTSRS